MPSFNRRGFLQFMSAAGVSTFLPSFSAQAVTAGTSTSKALWAGIYAKSGSVPKFLGVARNMGLSNTAIQGVSVRSIGVRIAVSAATNSITQNVGLGKVTLPSTTSSQTGQLKDSRKIMRDIKHVLSDETDETAVIVDQKEEVMCPTNTPNKLENDIH